MPFGPASILGVESFAQDCEAPQELVPGDDDAAKEAL
ncbi:MAG: photosystem I reaction center subunit XII, partial [Cyanobium sp.]